MKQRDKPDIEDCHEKINAILKEYGCTIEYDEEMKDVVIIDVDTSTFEVF